MIQSPIPSIARYPSTELADCGWRFEVFTQSDGSTIHQQVPLTAAEFLHPQEGYHLPNSTFHDDTAVEAENQKLEAQTAEMAALLARYREQFSDLPKGPSGET